jgi:hypothetical protein
VEREWMERGVARAVERREVRTRGLESILRVSMNTN